jgi:hypothetical protein
MQFNVWFQSPADALGDPHVTVEGREVEHFGETLTVVADAAAQIAVLDAWMKADEDEPRAWDMPDLDDNPPFALASETAAEGLHVEWWPSHDGETFAIERLPFPVTVRRVVAKPVVAPAHDAAEVDPLVVPQNFTLSDVLAAYAALDGSQAEKFVAAWDDRLAELHARAHALVRVGATLGSWERWPGSELLESVQATIDRASARTNMPKISGNDDDRARWRRAADSLGIDHDGE